MKQALDKLRFSTLQVQRIALAQALRSPFSARLLAERAIDDYFTDAFTIACFKAISGFVKIGVNPTPSLVDTRMQAEASEPWYYTALDLAKEVDSASYDFADILSILEETALRNTASVELLKTLDKIADISVDINSTMQELRTISEKSSKRTGLSSKTPSQIFKEREGEDPNANRIFTGDAFWDNVYFEKGGSRRGQIEFVIAHPKHGKTILAANRAAMYLASGYHVAWFNLEDTVDSTIDNVSQNMTQQDWYTYADNLHLADGVTLIEDIVEEVRLLKAKNMVDVVVIDYIQLLSARGFKPSEERSQQSFISKKLTRTAKELGVYVIPLSQLRRPEGDKNGWSVFPTYRAMKETSQYEQDAFVITAVFRPAMEPSLVMDGKVKWWDHRAENPSMRPANAVAIKCIAHRKQRLDHKVVELRHTDHSGLKVPDFVEDKINEYHGR